MLRRIVCCIACALLATTAISQSSLAQPITVQYQHGSDPVVTATYASGADVTINLDGDPLTGGLQPLSVDTLIRIFETGTSGVVAPVYSIGSITINGSVDPFITGIRLDILIGASTETSIPSQPTDLIAPGLINLGNSTSGVGIAITDTTLRDSTRLALSITGSTSGTIDLGHVFRFDTDDSVNGDITVRAANGSAVTAGNLGGFFDPIREFRVGNAILGDITATSGDIDSIIVFGTSATGIRGDIHAPEGHIRRIWTTGEIGSSTITPKIWAGIGIDEVIAGTDTGGSTPGAILDRDIKADIDARAGDFYLTQPFLQGTRFDGALSYVRTSGDISGTIRAANLTFGAGSAGQRGIIAEGVISAPVTIDFVLDHADIIGSSITAPIWIGYHARGAIAATDVTSGTISGVSGTSEPGSLAGYSI